MQKRKLGKSNLEVSAIGPGCMGMSFSYGPPADIPSLVARVQDLVAEGVRVKDACTQVAAAHPGVRSRQLYDAVLQARRED